MVITGKIGSRARRTCFTVVWSGKKGMKSVEEGAIPLSHASREVRIWSEVLVHSDAHSALKWCGHGRAGAQAATGTHDQSIILPGKTNETQKYLSSKL